MLIIFKVDLSSTFETKSKLDKILERLHLMKSDFRCNINLGDIIHYLIYFLNIKF